MRGRTATMIAAVALGATSCGSQEEEAAGNASAVIGAQSNDTTSTATATAANAAADAPPEQAAAPGRFTLASDGLAPGLTFGMKEDDAVTAATDAFGTPTSTDKNDDCGEGPMSFVHFGDLQLGFQEGNFAGWSLSGSKPALQTAGGITIGTPRSALGNTPIDEGSSIGPEFDVGGVGGFLDSEGKVMALWAGFPCQFR